MAKSPGSKTRLFLALDLPPAVRAAAARLVAPAEGLRPVAPESLHVTLVFLGWQSESGRVEEIAVETAATAEAIPLVPRSVRALPRRSPRLLALDLDDPGGGGAALYSALSGRLAEAGLYRPEKRPFWAHVTLARARKGARAELPARLGPLPGAFGADRLVLYRSVPGREGARYEPVSSWPLG